jgi:VWFA-related protein
MNTKTIRAAAFLLAVATASSLLALGGTHNPSSAPAPPANQAPSSAPGQAAQAPTNPAQTSTGASTVQQPRSQQPPAAIRATTRLVQVSVVVHDKHGDAISDLTKDDFVILDEKKPQEIRLFSMETNRVPEHAPPQLPPNTYTNRIQERGNVPTSITVLLFDGLNTQITDQAYARQQVVKFIQKQLQPQDRVAIYSLGHDLRILHDFSNDAASLLAALGSYKGQDTPQLDASEAQISDNPNPNIAAFLNNAYQYEANFFVTDRVHRTVEALTAIANHVGTLPGRKNLIWISGSFPFSIGYENIERSTSDARELYANDIETAARALTNANLAVYPVDARGLMTSDLGNRTSSANPRGGTMGIISNSAQNSDPRSNGPNTSNFDSMNVLADRTGGKAFYNRNDIWGSVREAIDDSRVTYELGYYPQGVDWNGSFHEIKVEVKRPGARVRARKGYFALPEPRLTPQIRQAIIAQSATSSLEPTGIGVQVRVQTVAGERKLHTVASFDLREFALERKDGRWSGAIDTVFIQLDNRNQIIAAIDDTFHLNLDPAKYEQLLKEGVTVTKDVPILPNAVEMRLVLRDGTTGTVGAVGVPLAKYFSAQSSSAN